MTIDRDIDIASPMPKFNFKRSSVAACAKHMYMRVLELCIGALELRMRSSRYQLRFQAIDREWSSSTKCIKSLLCGEREGRDRLSNQKSKREGRDDGHGKNRSRRTMEIKTQRGTTRPNRTREEGRGQRERERERPGGRSEQRRKTRRKKQRTN